VIAGARSPEQVSSNVAATHAWALTDAELREVDELTRIDVAYTIHSRSPAYSRPPHGVVV
jgi:aryl-alcohol dehydrogenase-like predicted oxidoreductase